MYLIKLFKANYVTVLTEALTAHIQTILANETVPVGTNSAAAATLSISLRMSMIDILKTHRLKIIKILKNNHGVSKQQRKIPRIDHANAYERQEFEKAPT